MSEVLFTLIKALLMVLGVILTTYVVPLIKEKTSSAQFELVMKYAKILVESVEQLKSSGQLSPSVDKKLYVSEKLTKWLNEKGIKITESQMNDLIESSVMELNKTK